MATLVLAAKSESPDLRIVIEVKAHVERPTSVLLSALMVRH
jgi:hypothetical protein